ncbi:MAG: 4Fe-4S binding protein [Spirochaetales bacterium]|nr:4Fe-4S binding protein [Spirochaetales bacterium]
MAAAFRKKNNWIRTGIQILFFAFVFFIVTFGPAWFSENGKTGDLHSICPFGAVETAGRLIFQGLFIPKTSMVNIITFSSLLLVTVLFGGVFCGWLCPLGSFQEWIGKLGKKVLGKKFDRLVPRWLDRFSRFLRYGVLALIIITTTQFVTLTFSAYDPFYALFHTITGSALPSAVAILGVTAIASFFVSRPWCRWFCPLGAVIGLVQKLSPWKIRTNQGCNECGICSAKCPVNIKIQGQKTITDSRCIKCGECVTACKKNGIALSLPKGKLAITRIPLIGVFTLAVFAMPIVASQGVKIAELAELQQQTESGIPLISVEEISASMTLADLGNNFHAAPEQIAVLLALPADIDPETKLRNLEDINEECTLRFIKDTMTRFQPGAGDTGTKNALDSQNSRE